MSKGKWGQTRVIIRYARKALEQESPMTLRQLFYQLVSKQIIENTRSQYQRLSRVMTEAREDGEVDFSLIVDRSRPTYRASVWDDPEGYAKAVKDSYRKDYWKDQPCHAEVWLEKDAVVGSIASVTDDLGVTVRVGRGFLSATVAHEIARLFAGINKPKLVFYLGDHDPSGRCIEREARERILRYGSGRFKMKRLAIHAADIQRFNLPSLRVKETDSRTDGFLSRYSDKCVELDALPPTELRSRLRNAIEAVLDRKSWDRMVAVEEVERNCIVDMVNRWPTVVARRTQARM